ncbi:MAG TPA: hypothetical protein VD968_06630 [Pyrinomonadaceae bacterium]|nr:hypothetical protein [Pyrinomonadaceae bacterium]
MGGFCEEVGGLIGDELRVIGATPIQVTHSGSGFDEKEVCFFSAADKIIAVSYSPQDGATCFITGAGQAELSRHETWDSLWHALGMDNDTDTLEGMTAYLEMFPEGHEEFIKFIGTCLVKYFGRTA